MKLSDQPARRLTAQELGVAEIREQELELASAPEAEPQLIGALSDALAADDPLLLTVLSLQADGYAGVILSGEPGTSKTYYARRLAATLCKQNSSRASFVQFHPSYQYEDFIESYQPTEAGGFAPKRRVFLELCEVAQRSNDLHVLIIDELSRTDAVRVFGEALTYLEKSQRGIEFELASGRVVSIPDNIFIIATMNPWDRGVDELDMAFERRFAKINLYPSEAELGKILEGSNLSELIRTRVLTFFRKIQTVDAPHARIGHGYFSRVTDSDSLHRLWQFQLSHHFKRAFHLNPEGFTEIERAWAAVLNEPDAVQ